METRLLTMKEMAEIVNAETLYKVAHIEEEGFSSCFIGHPVSFLRERKMLRYHIGRVTTAQPDSKGIYCYEEAKCSRAQSHAAGMAGIAIEKPCVVLEVKPLGELSGGGRPMSVYVVGVYEEEEKKEEPKYVNPFKVGDRVRVKASVDTPKCSWGSVRHGDVGEVKTINEERMDVYFPTFCEGHSTWSAHAPEMELVPEPKEEWVDVTQELTCSINNYGENISVSHKGVRIGVVGLLPFALMRTNYKAEEVCRGFGPQIIGGKILKKVTK